MVEERSDFPDRGAPEMEANATGANGLPVAKVGPAVVRLTVQPGLVSIRFVVGYVMIGPLRERLFVPGIVKCQVETHQIIFRGVAAGLQSLQHSVGLF